MLAIAIFSQQEWGEIQAKKYIRELRECCALLVLNPDIGRAATLGRWSGRRMEQGSHVIFYRADRTGILVQRVLHKNMLLKLS